MKSVTIGLVTTLLLATNIAYAQQLDKLNVQYDKLVRKINPRTFKIDFKSGPEGIKTQLQALLPKDKKMKMKIDQGTVDSGGGTLVSDSLGIGLLDLYLYNKAAFTDTTKSPDLPVTKSYLNLGMDRLAAPNIAIYRKTFNQLDKWESSSPVIVSWVKRSLQYLTLYYVNYDLGFQDRNFFIPSNVTVQKSHLRLGAFYIGGFGAFVSKKAFDALSEKNQMALLIHESLRQAQINFDAGFTNEDIQKITAILVGVPLVFGSVDQIQFMHGPVLEQFLDESSSLIWIGYTIGELCKQSAKFCSLKDLKGQSQVSAQLQKIIGEMTKDGDKVPQFAFDVLIELQSIEIDRSTKEYKEVMASFGRNTNFGWLDASLRNYNGDQEVSQSARNVSDFIHNRVSAGHFIKN